MHRIPSAAIASIGVLALTAALFASPAGANGADRDGGDAHPSGNGRSVEPRGNGSKPEKPSTPTTSKPDSKPDTGGRTDESAQIDESDESDECDAAAGMNDDDACDDLDATGAAADDACVDADTMTRDDDSTCSTVNAGSTVDTAVLAAEGETIVIGVVETFGGGATIAVTPSGDTAVRAASGNRPVLARVAAGGLAFTGDHILVLMLLALTALALGAVMVRSTRRPSVEA